MINFLRHDLAVFIYQFISKLDISRILILIIIYNINLDVKNCFLQL